MPQHKCCDCGCNGSNCLENYAFGCYSPCCWCQGLLGYTTCDDEYFAAFYACMDQVMADNFTGAPGNPCGDLSITVQVDLPANPYIEQPGPPCTGAAGEVPKLYWNTLYQITNPVGGAIVAGTGDPPTTMPCSGYGGSGCKKTVQDPDPPYETTCTGDMPDCTGSCWDSCPDWGFLWKASHYNLETTQTWPDTEDTVEVVLHQYAPCKWEGNAPVPGYGERIWLDCPNAEYAIVEDDCPDKCTGGSQCDPFSGDYDADCINCCYCTDDCVGVVPPGTQECGCMGGYAPLNAWSCRYCEQGPENLGDCDGSVPCAFRNMPPLACNSPLDNIKVQVKYTLKYSIELVFEGDGINIEPFWQHSVSLDPYYVYPGADPSVPPSTGQWATIPVGNCTGLTPWNYYCRTSCNELDCDDPPTQEQICQHWIKGTNLDDWTFCQYLARYSPGATGFGMPSICNPSDYGSPTPSPCPPWGLNFTTDMFWSNDLPTVTVSTEDCVGSGACGEECTMDGNCYATAVYNGCIFEGEAMNHNVALPTECHNPCPESVTFESTDWVVRVTVVKT